MFYFQARVEQSDPFIPFHLALCRRIVSYVSCQWLWGFLLYEDLLLVLLDHLLVLLLSGGHEFHQLILYMHAMMMQHLVF